MTKTERPVLITAAHRPHGRRRGQSRTAAVFDEDWESRMSDWLLEQLTLAEQEVASWPEWMQQQARWVGGTETDDAPLLSTLKQKGADDVCQRK